MKKENQDLINLAMQSVQIALDGHNNASGINGLTTEDYMRMSKVRTVLDVQFTALEERERHNKDARELAKAVKPKKRGRRKQKVSDTWNGEATPSKKRGRPRKKK